MPIQISGTLPAAKVLAREGIDVWSDGAGSPGVRPLRIGVVNLMPDKCVAESQIARLLGSTPYTVSMRLLVPDACRPGAGERDHVDAHYQRWSQVRGEWFDGLVVTGASVEHLECADVPYFDELTRIVDWTQTNVGSSLFICWGAQVALRHAHGVAARRLDEKLFGVFVHDNLAPRAPLMRGFDCVFAVPVSRQAEIAAGTLPHGVGLEVLSDSPEVGPCLVEDRPRRALYALGHFEYDAVTLRADYRRAAAAGEATVPPRYYFPDDDPSQTPVNTWRHHAHLLFRNWLREVTYVAMARGERTADGADVPATR